MGCCYQRESLSLLPLFVDASLVACCQEEGFRQEEASCLEADREEEGYRPLMFTGGLAAFLRQVASYPHPVACCLDPVL